MTFKFFAIPVTIHGSFWLLSALFAFSRIDRPVLVVEWIAVMGLAIFIHELGHALAFRFYGHRPAIELHGMGGLTHSLGGEKILGPGRDAVVTFAGPLAGYVLALIVWCVTKMIVVPAAPALGGVLVGDLLWASAGWSTLNLCPMLPLDGGLLMFAALRARLGERAPAVAYGASLVVAIVAMIASRWAGWTWTLYMCVWFAARNGQALVALRQKPAQKNPEAVPKPIAGTADPLFLQAQVLACETWLRRGELSQAWNVAKDLPDRALDADLLQRLGAALLKAQMLTLAELVGARRFVAFAAADGAVQAARAAALDGRVNDAFLWLERAVKTGGVERGPLEGDAAFARLRNDPRWASVTG